ncbi:MAG: formate dehydrogenase [Desulfitibacter sp. BRH_c19]|nr:MAG: formate dehydrogenase [Desulfitibacter sp. BRH_c19]
MTNSINEILQADVILVIGSNTTETHPVIGYRVKQAAKKGAKVIVIDPRQIDLVKYSYKHLPMRPATNIALLNGLSNVIISEKLYDEDFVKHRTEGWQDWVNSVKEYTPEKVEKITGIPAKDIIETARLYAKADKGSIIYAMGITQHTSGTSNVLAVANLAMATGNVGKEGTGVNPLRGQNNVQGACDMGCLPDLLPGYQSVENIAHRKKFASYWNCEIPAETGLTLTEIMEETLKKNIKGLYIMGENPILSDPDSNHIQEALQSLEFLVVQDIFLTETAKLADVVLPATSFAEKDGTFVNTERRIQRVRKAVPAPGQALADWEILQKVANEMGQDWNYSHPEEIMEEITQLTPSYAGIDYSRIDKVGIQWPCPDKEHPGTKFLHCDKFACGLGKFRAVEFLPSDEEPDAKYPFLLMTGRGLYQFHTGTMSRRIKSLDWIHPEELMQINPEDAHRLSLDDGDLVEVKSRRGKLTTRIKITRGIPKDSVFMTFHFKESPANVLTNAAHDPICKIPELKAAAVSIMKIEDHRREEENVEKGAGILTS